MCLFSLVIPFIQILEILEGKGGGGGGAYWNHCPGFVWNIFSEVVNLL